ncbi:hypothetical protein VTN00DRAFT_749 [Thermoascus crustaceus]|uniref:uncharacterized protein n=1 Tax=Thermoascus crustaceus TaxID=5088 RepID=UPI003742BEBD
MHLVTSLLLLLGGSTSLVKAWLPTDQSRSLSAFTNGNTTKIRGVNLGSHFIVEPWMAYGEWVNMMGCKDSSGNQYRSEWDCVQGLGQDAANAVFKKHWQTWITEEDISTMVECGLNTIRILVGFWMKEDLVADDEYYPKNNAIEDLQNVCRWATAAGMYIIIDLHGMPGAQQKEQPFTGRWADQPYFYLSDYHSGRAYEFLEWMVEKVHSSDAFSNVGALEIINEPLQLTENGQTAWMVEHYYPSAVDRIRAKEKSLGVAEGDQLHIMMMDDKWDSGGNPTRSLNSTQKQNLLFDDHNYEAYLVRNAASIPDMVSLACSDDRQSSVSPKIVGEWSLMFWQTDNTNSNGTNGTFTPMPAHAAEYSRWFSAQQRRYEELDGWVFWTWKTDAVLRDEEMWSYKKAVDAGIISKDLNEQYNQNPC